MTPKRLAILAGIGLMATSATASAHVSYTNRDFVANGSFDGADTYTLSGQRVTSNYGWADGADGDWGDSHKARFLKFTLTEASGITITVSAQPGVASTLDDLAPAFSVYAGLVPHLSHDGANNPAYLANHPGFIAGSGFATSTGKVGDKEGAFQALDNFWLGNDAGIAAEIGYIGHAIDGVGIDINGDRVTDLSGDGSPDRVVSAAWLLGPGAYTVVVGGACYLCQYTESEATWQASRAFTASLQIAPVPEPETWALTGAGLTLLGLLTRKRRGRS